MVFSKGKNRSNSSNIETTHYQAKKRHTSTDEPIPILISTIQTFELVENPSLTTICHQTPTHVSSNQLIPHSTIQASRRGKYVIDDLTIKVEGVTLYKGMAPERMDHYVDILAYMAHEKQLDAMCEDVNPTLVVGMLLFQLSSGSNLYFARLYYPITHLYLNPYVSQFLLDSAHVRA